MAGIGRVWIGAGSAAMLSVGGLVYATGSPAAAPPGITITSAFPNELNPSGGGAPNATLQQAAAFAWQEFIALNWPAAVDSSSNPIRDTPASDCFFGTGKGAPDCPTRPLTWETFRGKAEIFGANPGTQYSAPPQYAKAYTPLVGACPTQAPVSKPAWVNLDETSEIGLDAMYAGVNPAGANPSGTNADQQLIRFAAKANGAEYAYAIANSKRPTPTASKPITLPHGTVELKAAWRQLTPTEAGSGRFHMAKVRYYENHGPMVVVPQAPPNKPYNTPGVCWREAVWGLIGLHIIQKTQSAPYFIYATFEQADNILNPAGNPVEDPAGLPLGPPVPAGTNPATSITDGPNPPGMPGGPAVTIKGSAYCPAPANGRPVKQLYYLNTKGSVAVPTGGPICINRRDRPIPAEIVAANQQAHSAIAAYSRQNGVTSPWAYYKLINVQYKPMTKKPGVTYKDPGTSQDPGAATYYMANSVIETNSVLQNFSGGLTPQPIGGPSSDYAIQFAQPGQPKPPANAPFYNVSVPTPGGQPARYLMGGCMGCHGNAQAGGADFSFIAFGIGASVIYPDPVPAYTPAGIQVRAIRPRTNGTPRRTAAAAPRSSKSR